MASYSPGEGGKGEEQADPTRKLGHDLARSPAPSLEEPRDQLAKMRCKQEDGQPGSRPAEEPQP